MTLGTSVRTAFRWALAAIVLTSCLALTSLAAAAGSIKPESSTLKEEDGKWKLKLTIDYGGTPEIQFIPMNFSFEQVVLYERALTDEGGDKPVITKRQLQNQPPIIESMDVGFSDGTGKMFKVTKFNFVIRRDRHFEAGEYMLTVKKADGGQQIGQKIRLTLNGDNPVINRKSITFVDDKGKEDPSKVKSKADPGAYDKKDEPASSDSAPASSDSGSSAEPPPAVEPKQGGCGCRVAGEAPAGTGAALAAFLALSGGVALRRRRRPSERAVA
jgi:MYXO-CTERM domain-containing protein